MKLITITGPSGAGKGFLKDYIKQRWPFIYEPSWYTTRPPRADEGHRGDRICISEKKFIKMESQNLFLLTDMVGGYIYGLLREDLHQHEVCLTELRLHLLQAVQYETTFSIALMPQSIDFLWARLNKRGSEDKPKIEERISIAKKEITRIISNRDLFDLFLTVGAHNEHLVVGETLKFVEPFITERK